MNIRSYSPADRAACFRILASNIPEYFLPTDRDTFSEFLDHLPGPYFALDPCGQIVACGGWAIDETGVADLTWAMVRRDLHGRGLGRELLRFRLDAIRQQTQATLVRVRTTQLVQGFFTRNGFRVMETVVNGYGTGQDMVTMELVLKSNSLVRNLSSH